VAWRFQYSTEQVSQLLLTLGIRRTALQPRTPFSVGDHVFVRRSFRAPLSGHTGRIIAIDMTDSRGPYLTQFNNGLHFRYRPEELRPFSPEIPLEPTG
jgi:hypothetical protein